MKSQQIPERLVLASTLFGKVQRVEQALVFALQGVPLVGGIGSGKMVAERLSGRIHGAKNCGRDGVGNFSGAPTKPIKKTDLRQQNNHCGSGNAQLPNTDSSGGRTQRLLPDANPLEQFELFKCGTGAFDIAIKRFVGEHDSQSGLFA